MPIAIPYVSASRAVIEWHCRAAENEISVPIGCQGTACASPSQGAQDMEWIKNIPEWVGVAILGAVFAIAGYIGKSTVDWWQEKQKERAATVAQLQTMQSLLSASRAIFDLQQIQLERLMTLLEKSHSKEYHGSNGYEEIISRCYATMNEQEKELHGIIRAYTEHSLRKVNHTMSDWLKADTTFKTGNVPSVRRRELASELIALEIHLLLWQAKFESWVPRHLEHALVYMADEKAHGLGFPGERESVENGITVKQGARQGSKQQPSN